MHQLLQIDEPLIEKGFDEESMFKIKSSEFLAATPELLGSHEDIDKIQKKLEAELAFKQELKKQFQAKFRNISMIMDCVGKYNHVSELFLENCDRFVTCCVQGVKNAAYGENYSFLVWVLRFD